MEHGLARLGVHAVGRHHQVEIGLEAVAERDPDHGLALVEAVCRAVEADRQPLQAGRQQDQQLAAAQAADRAVARGDRVQVEMVQEPAVPVVQGVIPAGGAGFLEGLEKAEAVQDAAAEWVECQVVACMVEAGGALDDRGRLAAPAEQGRERQPGDAGADDEYAQEMLVQVRDVQRNGADGLPRCRQRGPLLLSVAAAAIQPFGCRSNPGSRSRYRRRSVTEAGPTTLRGKDRCLVPFKRLGRADIRL